MDFSDFQAWYSSSPIEYLRFLFLLGMVAGAVALGRLLDLLVAFISSLVIGVVDGLFRLFGR